MKHSEKVLRFLRGTETKPVTDLNIGCPECGRKVVSREGNIGYCENGHGINI